jgi:hypothetical protein
VQAWDEVKADYLVYPEAGQDACAAPGAVDESAAHDTEEPGTGESAPGD